ncbi:CHAP domain-containing protein [Sphingobium sp. RAC03]|uniref:CHAP domain-containing protein n=1 Tax=Sphingobium sp. RAC03 TaxID=1843368 RepID=UPI00083CAD34|nr:CHAP domain-containing protein [Sphingobium sp. RAC03]AOF97171.1 CHAP domain protein [Sphingobium sp. RAC03]
MIRGLVRAAALLASGLTAAPLWSAAVLQCVPYARIVSGVDIRGDALTWWDQASQQYKRGAKPKKGAVLAFRPHGPMMLGHVAVVSRVLDDRRVLIRHANWSVPGAIEEDVLAIDVSDGGDWSQVRVWHSPTAQMGARTNPTFGFIYPAKAKLHDFTPDPALGSSVRFAKIDADMWDRRRPHRAPAPHGGIMVAQAPAAPARVARKAAPRLEADLRVVSYADATPSQRTLSAIIADVKRQSVLN